MSNEYPDELGEPLEENTFYRYCNEIIYLRKEKEEFLIEDCSGGIVPMFGFGGFDTRMLHPIRHPVFEIVNLQQKINWMEKILQEKGVKK